MLVATLLLAAPPAAAAWTTVTMYDVLPADCRADVGDKNLGDPLDIAPSARREGAIMIVDARPGGVGLSMPHQANL